MDTEYTPEEFFKNVILDMDIGKIKLGNFKKHTPKKQIRCGTCQYYWDDDGLCHCPTAVMYRRNVGINSAICQEYYMDED